MNESTESSWGRYGIYYSIFGAIFTSSGLCLQKMVQIELSNSSKLQPQPLYKNKYYVFGICFVVIGTIFKIINYGILPQSIFGPLSALTVIFTKLFEIYFLDEKLSFLLILSLSTIIIGIILCINNSNINDPVYSLDHILKLFIREDVIFYTSIIIAAILSTKIVFKFSTSSSISQRNLFGLLYHSILAGIFSGWSCTLGKAVVEVCLYTTYSGVNEFYHISTWLLLFALPMFSVPKTRIVHEGLRQFHHLLFLPCYQVGCRRAVWDGK
eukprot:gene3171-6255_t